MLPMFGGLLFVSFVMMTLAVEVALLGAAWRRTADIVDIAVEAGAAMVDEGRLHDGGVVVLDPRAAESAARGTAETFDVVFDEIVVQVDERSICLTVRSRHPTRGLRFIGMREIPIELSRCAVPAVG